MSIVLICSGGVSAAIFIKKLRMLAKQEGIQIQLSACSITQLDQKVDVLLLSPQVAYAKKQLLPYVNNPSHILVLDSFTYSSLDAHKPLKQIKELINQGV